jgi:membrane protein DedA with SNARE-associated domain
MAHVVQFLTSHPVAWLAAAIVLEQAGLPVASAPLLLLIGAVTGAKCANAPLALLVSVTACVFVDYLWFEIGRKRQSNHGPRCKGPRSADSRYLRIANLFARHGGVAMFAARFIPGPNLAAALAGFSTISRKRFVLTDTIVSALWSSLFLATGHFLPLQLRSGLSSAMTAAPGWSIFLVLGFAAAFLGASRFRHHLARRSSSRRGISAPVASQTIITAACLPSEAGQTVTGQ